MFLDAVSFKIQLSGRSDYGFHYYFELCQFVYCLLSRSRKISALPSLDAWEDYMDKSKLAGFEKVEMDDFLRLHEFSAELRRRNTSEVQDFNSRCREFFDHFVEVILGHHVVASHFTQVVYCVCPQLLLEVDDRHVFLLFKKLVRVLEQSESLSSTIAKAAIDEFMSFVVDVRARHSSSDCKAENVVDIVTYLLADHIFMSRRNLCRVFKLRCLVVQRSSVG